MRTAHILGSLSVGLFSVFLLALPARAAVMDFEDPDIENLEPGVTTAANPYSEAGLTLTDLTGTPDLISRHLFGLNNQGNLTQRYVVISDNADTTDILVLNATDGRPFSLFAIDAANLGGAESL